MTSDHDHDHDQARDRLAAELAFLALPRPTDLRIATPDSWCDLRLDRHTHADHPDTVEPGAPGHRRVAGTRPQSARGAARPDGGEGVEAEVARVVRARVRRFPQLAPHAREITGALLGVAREAAAGGATLVALMSEPADNHVLTASLVVTSAPALRDPHGRPALVAGDLATALAGEGDVSIVELPQSPAVRVQRTNETAPAGGGSAITSLLVQYHIAVPGSPERTLLSFATPALGLAEEMAWLFDLVASTFHYRWDVAGSDGSAA